MLHLARPVRHRRIAEVAAVGLPLVIAAAAIAWRVGTVVAAVVVALLAVVVVVATGWRASRIADRWLAHRLDAARVDMDDSADLLFTSIGELPPMARLQRDRLERRIAAAAPDLRPQWRSGRIAAAWLVTVLVVVAVVGVPRRPSSVILAATHEGRPVVAGIPHLIGIGVRVVPPAYTGIPARDATTLDLRAPQGSRLAWTFRFAPQPTAGDLVFADGSRVALVRAGDVWTAQRALARSILYRVVARGGAVPPLHRLDAIVDTPPVVRIVAPDRSLSLRIAEQARWPLDFEARDDYGVAPTAHLHLTVAEGEGESVKFRETVIAVRGSGSATVKRFRVAPDLAGLRFVAGSDLIAQLVVSDNRAPGPQTAQSPSLILRWPSSAGTAAGMEGVVTRALPAYFRSERQVIIDAEALLKEQTRLTPERFLARSDGIAADQRLLRLRYGQFLGEEQEGTTPPPPTADAPSPPSSFGREGETLEQFGHVHDEAEASTLLDPDVRTKLKAALDAMWQAELGLRQGAPRAALPFAYRALGFIKQVQQATRVFLARVGPDLPVVDETRRLSGKRDGLARSALPTLTLAESDLAPAAAWRALADPAGPTATQLAAFDRWARVNPTIVDPLAVAAVIDALTRDPACVRCRATLRGLVWAALPRPAPGVARRAGGDAAGRRYLDALSLAR
jgi:hypothetical protein